MRNAGTADSRLVRALGLQLARVKSVETYDDGLDFFARELEVQTSAWKGHEEWLGAAFAKGGAVALLTGGFRIMAKIGGPAAGAQWLRFVLDETTKSLRPEADLDTFLVGPKLDDYREVGRKVVPPAKPLDVKATLDVIQCALEAAAAQFRQCSYNGAADAVLEIAKQVPSLKWAEDKKRPARRRSH